MSWDGREYLLAATVIEYQSYDSVNGIIVMIGPHDPARLFFKRRAECAHMSFPLAPTLCRLKNFLSTGQGKLQAEVHVDRAKLI